MTSLFRRPTNASTTSAAPSYRTILPDSASPSPSDRDLIGLGTLNSTTSLPTYKDVTTTSSGPFVPSQKLRIETRGKALVGLPLPPRPDPIPIYDVTSGITPEVPLYVSLRRERCSGTCTLVRGDDQTQTPLCTTSYRFGPGKPPVISLRKSPNDSNETETNNNDETNNDNNDSLDMTLTSPQLLHRTQLLRSPYGTFTWRYATGTERKQTSASTNIRNIHSLLLFERVVRVSLAGGSKTEDRRHPVARLIRSDDTRTEGSGRSTAGNGGLLEMDLRAWQRQPGGGEDEKSELAVEDTEEEQVRLLIVSSCVSMLKKEVDRRRLHQAIVIMGGASGGGS